MGFDRLANGKWYGRKFAHGKQKGSLLCEYTPDKTEPKTAKEAQVAYENFCGAVRTGKAYLPEQLDKKISVAQFVAYYRRTSLAKKQLTGNDVESVLKKVETYFNNRPITVFAHGTTFELFYEFLANEPITVRKMVKGKVQRVPTDRRRSAKTLSEYIKRVRHLAERAYAADFIETNPFIKDPELMGGIVASEGRNRGVSEAEVAALYKACDKPLGTERKNRVRRLMRERIEVSVRLGLRRKEMQYLQLEDIDFENWIATLHTRKRLMVKGVEREVRTSKSKKTRVVPIDSMKALFQKKREQFTLSALKGKAFLFGINGHYSKRFDRTWLAIKADAGLDDATLMKQKKLTLHWHDLRGEAGTRMLERGANPVVIADILGNTPAVFAKHYKRETLDLMRKAVG